MYGEIELKKWIFAIEPCSERLFRVYSGHIPIFSKQKKHHFTFISTIYSGKKNNQEKKNCNVDFYNYIPSLITTIPYIYKKEDVLWHIFKLSPRLRIYLDTHIISTHTPQCIMKKSSSFMTSASDMLPFSTPLSRASASLSLEIIFIVFMALNLLMPIL